MNERCKTGRLRAAAFLTVLCLLLTGCGNRLVITRGFADDELFRIGAGSCREGEYMVYLLDLQKHCERMFGSTIWAEDTDGTLKESVRSKALAEVSRVKTLGLLAVEDNIMLTNEEQQRCARAASDYYAALSEDEKTAVGLTEAQLQKMMEEYALADKVYRSLGSAYAERLDAYMQGLDSDMNLPLWDQLTVRKVYGDAEAMGFKEYYTAYFGQDVQETESDTEGVTGQ